MDRDTLFLRTLDELEARTSGQDAYDLLMVAGLLRKLLLDRFVDDVNKERRLKIRYQPNDYPILQLPPSAGMTLWTLQDGFDPEVSDIQRPLDVAVGGLLSRPMMVILGEVVSVKDVISYLANKAGAVHVSEPFSAKEKALAQLDATMTLAGNPPVIRTMLAVTRVVLRGLQPLRDVVAAEKGNTGATRQAESDRDVQPETVPFHRPA
jgi:hypothetical protein